MLHNASNIKEHTMSCQRCIESMRTAYAKLNVTTSENELPYRSVIHQESISELYRSVLEGCWICQQLWEEILKKVKAEQEYDSDSSEDDSSFTEHEALSSTEFEAPEKWRIAQDFPTKLVMMESKNHLILILRITDVGLEHIMTPILLNETIRGASVRQEVTNNPTSAKGSIELWNQWLRTCSESHTSCRELDQKQQQFVPKRLVEMITQDDGRSFTWKVIHCADIGCVPFLTLSHCWGASGHKCLTKENHLDLSEPSDYAELPNSFRHAFLISFSLGFRYIWIDSLCIVQDDLDDWRTQASMMGMIYKNACCNIAATWARDGDGGCFSTKRKFHSITLDLGFQSVKEWKIESRMRYYDDIFEAPLNERGWVTQERFLARKQLSFAKSQVYWECHELVASEEYPAGIPSYLTNFSPYNQAISPTRKPTLRQTTDANRREAWAALVDFYSERKFSKVSDKMIALAGLAEEMRNAMDDVYLAGLWKKDLERQLCWSTDYDLRMRFNRSLISTYLAPTWSWVRVDGPVLSDMSYYAVEKCVSFVEILDASVHSEHPSKLHSFVASTLVLRGIAIPGRARRRGNEVGVHEDADWEIWPTNLSDIEASFRISIRWDENLVSQEMNPQRWPRFLEERNSDFLFLFVHLDPKDPVPSGLLLRSLPSAPNEVAYVRMGVFTDFWEILSNLFSVRLGYTTDRSDFEEFDLNDSRLEDLIHTVTIL